MLIPTKNEIRSHFNAAEFVLSTRRQINKDLSGLSTFEVPLETNEISIDPLQHLSNDLIPILEKLRRESHLTQFIYKVDLSEELYRQVLAENNDFELSILIIQREAQKVFLRKKFSL